MCEGQTCSAHPIVRKACEEGVFYVYLASFGSREIKAGVSRADRIVERWVEQGADFAARVLKGNGRDVRRYEKQVQDQLGALRLLRGNEKINVIQKYIDPERSMRLLNALKEKINGTFPEEHQFDEEIRTLTPFYGLPEIRKKPLAMKVRDGLEISGRILGVKGPILLLEKNDLVFALDLNGLTGRKIDTEDSCYTATQTGLDGFLKL